MKKILFAWLFSVSTVILNAQFVVGGQFNLSKQKIEFENSDQTQPNDVIETMSFTIIPRLSYRFSNWLSGIDAGYSKKKNLLALGGPGETKTSKLFSISPFIRYTQKPADFMGFWAELQAGISFGNEQVNNEKAGDQTKYDLGIRPGIVFFIGDHLWFESSYGRLGFSSDKKENIQSGLTNENKNEFGFTLGDTFLFGVNWMF